MRTIFALSLVLVVVFFIHAADYYVSTTGSDNGTGSPSAPWKTLQHAAELAQPGWTIHVAPGSYNSTIYCSGSDYNGTAMVCMKTSGTVLAPITFVSDTTWGAKLSLGTNGVGMFFIDASYIRIVGFDMTGPDGIFAAITYGNNGHNEIRNNYLHDFAVATCNFTGVLCDGNAGYDIFDGNVIHHAGAIGGNAGNCIGYHGIYMARPNTVATNNIISGIIGIGIHAYGAGICHQTIANNTVFDCSQGGIIAENVGTHSGYTDMCSNGGTTDYETIINNITVNNGIGNGYTGGWGGINVYGSSVGSHNIISNNLAYGNQPFQISVTSPSVSVNEKTGSNATVFTNYQADKNWAPAANYNSLNYALKSGSPAIDAGIATGAPAKDVIGHARPQGSGYDIGAYEMPGPTTVLPSASGIKSFRCTITANLINYILPKACFVSIKYYDLQGRTVWSFANKYQATGNYSLKLPEALSRNIYIQEFRASDFVKKERLAMTR
ncbi:MAG: choice-of-anchor Q domain-containing protein [Chitinivibrionales bacterium]|nr:choice-of-anchor Q domain-containing protein [Chitinivibrionales bacterium]